MSPKPACSSCGASPRMGGAGNSNSTCGNAPQRHECWYQGVSPMNVGIDLGTTNSALAYIDPQEAAESDFPPIHVVPIEQQVDANRVAALRTLPSFLYLSDPPVVGAYAREQGALVPTKTVHSAKSWLSNSEADRTAKILPWDSQEEGRVPSPVEASSRYLAHLRDSWERSKGAPLAGQQVVLTVPASFDEEAR